MSAGEVGRLVAGLRAAGLDAREVEQRVDELQQPQPVAVRHLERCDDAPEGAVGSVASASSSGPEHQRQRRAELVADVREERRLRPVDLGQRLGAPPLLLVGLGVGDGRRDLARGEAEEAAVALVEQAEGVEADDEDAGAAGVAARRRSAGSRAWAGGWRQAPVGRSAPTVACRSVTRIAARACAAPLRTARCFSSRQLVEAGAAASSWPGTRAASDMPPATRSAR